MSDKVVANTMSKAEKEVKKPESCVWIQTADGYIQEVEQEVATLCPTIDHEMKSGLGSSKNNPIIILPSVRATSLSLVFDYCRFHQVRRSNQEHKTFDENFLQMDARSLSELVTLANYLQLGPLIDCTCDEMARRMCNNSTEEIGDMLNLSDLPEVEKSESRGHSAYDARIRLMEKLYKKKKQTVVKEIENLKNFMAGIKARQLEDTRKVDDLVSFVNGDAQTSKRRRNRRKKAQKKTSSSITTSSSEASVLKKVIKNHDEDSNASDSAKDSGSTAETSKLLGTRDGSFNGKEDVDDSDLDPALKEEIRREVVELARRLYLNYDELI